MALSSAQRGLAAQLVAIGRKQGASTKEIKAALETGLVESNLTNLKGGDADSAGWRQERASLYPDPTNVQHSAERFFRETHAVAGKYGTAGALAAAVQRPAAQYRGRYQDRSGEAGSLLAQLAGHGGGTQSASGGGSVSRTTGGDTTVSQSYTPGSVSLNAEPSPGLTNLLSQGAAPARQQVSHAGAIQAPAYANKYATSGAAPIQPVSTQPAGQDAGLADKLATIAQSAQPQDSTVTDAQGNVSASQSPVHTVHGESGADPASAGGKIGNIVARANTLDKRNLAYQYGGGHGGGKVNVHTTGPIDCSAAVSAVLGVDTRVSGEFEKWGAPGKAKGGNGVTVYANGGHTFLQIGNRYFGTSGFGHPGKGGGAAWFTVKPGSDYLKGFTARHLPGT